MPVRIGKKSYKSFGRARAAIQKKRHLSKKRAAAYVAAVERKEHIDPRTGKRLTKKRKR